MVYFLNSLNDLPSVAASIMKAYSDKRIFAFYGEMGAGKTTVIKEICSFLEAQETVNSPTFSIINEYTTDTHGSIYHFDFYRINKIEDVFDLGYEEYFYSNNYCFIEWAEKVVPILPEKHIAIKISVCENNKRKLEIVESN